MATIVKAAQKQPENRVSSDIFKIKAGKMLTMDQLSRQKEVAEHSIISRVVRRNIARFQGCTALPLTLLYFFFYAFASRLHEDITNVFFMESQLRDLISDSTYDIESIPDLWDYLEGDFLDTFFSEVDERGEPRTKRGSGGDLWGTWGRVLTFNQLQGLIRFDQTRDTLGSYGKTYHGPWDPNLQILNLTREGFRKVESMAQVPPSLADVTLDTIPRGEEEYPPLYEGRRLSEEEEDHDDVVAESESRRLEYVRPTLRDFLPADGENAGEKFRFWLFPKESGEATRRRLNYFKESGYLDGETRYLQIGLYLLNCELGRPRLLDIKMMFAFSRGGGVYNRIEMQTIMMEMFPDGKDGAMSACADFLWLFLLVLTTLHRVQLAWSSFVKGKLLGHILQLFTLWEWAVLGVGWFCVWGFAQQWSMIRDMRAELEEIRKLRWDADSAAYVANAIGFYDVAERVTFQLSYIRFLMAQYLLFLMFRFLVSFQVQPRLATVTQTMKAVIPDLFHFFIMFVPTFMAYAISGHLIYGRRLVNYSNMKAAISTCFRMMMECEYDWGFQSLDFFWTTALWIWSFIFLLVLMMINMVLAIILDVYNEVREASLSSETVFTTLFNYGVRLYNVQHWVPDIILSEEIDGKDGSLKGLMVSRVDIKQKFPMIPEAQLELMYRSCILDEKAEAERQLDKVTCLKMTGSMKMTADSLNESVSTFITDKTPIQSYTDYRHNGREQAKLQMMSKGFFLGMPPKMRGNQFLELLDPKYQKACMPEMEEGAMQWKVDLVESMKSQRKWMLWIDYHLQDSLWNLHQAHFSQMKSKAKMVQGPL